LPRRARARPPTATAVSVRHPDWRGGEESPRSTAKAARSAVGRARPRRVQRGTGFLEEHRDPQREAGLLGCCGDRSPPDLSGCVEFAKISWQSLRTASINRLALL